MNQPLKQPVCAVVGVGPGNGEALVRRFASAGHAVALLARRRTLIESLASELPGARAFQCEVGDEMAVAEAFARIAAEMAPVDTLVYNVGKGVCGARWTRSRPKISSRPGEAMHWVCSIAPTK